VQARHLELSTLVGDFSEQTRVLNGEGRLGGEGREEPHDLGPELAGRLPDHRQAANQAIFTKKRNGEKPSVPRTQENVADRAPDAWSA